MRNNKQAHEFAIYVAQLTHLLGDAKEDVVRIDDVLLAHRVHNVLRIQPEQTIILFDREQHARCIFKSVLSKRTVEVAIQHIQKNQVLSPSIIFLLPILKRDAFETALYAMVELGATVVQPIITQKIHKMWLQEKDIQRMERIMIAAAEQSKHFALPELLKPCTLNEALKDLAVDQRIYFDPDGQELFAIAKQLREQKPNTIALMVGPEGDLTSEEKEYLKKQQFLLCKLTPTILRASQAAALSLGILRTMLHS